MGIRLYLRFWRECACEAWHGSWGRANALAIFGVAILCASAWWLGLTKEAPSSIEGTIGFALFIGISSLLLAWIVIFIVRLLGAPARLDIRKLAMSDLEHILRGRFVFNESVYGGDFGLMCSLNLSGKFDIEQLRDTFTKVKVPAPANSLARTKINFTNSRQNIGRKCYFYILNSKGIPQLVENIYEEQRVRLDGRACFQLKFVHEDSYTLYDQASLSITVRSWSR